MPPSHNFRDRLSHALVILAAILAAVYAVLAGGGGSGASDIAGPASHVAVPPPMPEMRAALPSREELAPAPAAEATPVSRQPTAASEVEPSRATIEAPLKGPWPTIDAARIQALGISTPTPTAKQRCEPSESAAYCIYTVQEGDTLSHVAERFGLNGGDLPGWELLAASNKPDITSIDDFIQPGQKLRVPTSRGVVHAVLLDETVGDLADVFDVSSRSIIAANGLGSGDLLTIGQVLLIPDPSRLEPPPAASSGQPEEKEEPSSERPDEPETAPEPARPRGFIWPVSASPRITNYMSGRHPLGIDLGLGHAAGSPIVAVDDGKVVFAGGNACCSYGLYVIVEHDNGLKTLYGHLRRLDVRAGERVTQGQTLGPSGSTGYSTGVHLHFEVHKDGKRVDPMPYLP